MTKNIIIDEKLENYISDNTYSLHPIQKEIIEYNKALGDLIRMQVSVTQAYFFQFMIKLNNINKILEIGTFTGYSAIKMAKGNPDCEIHTCELMEQHVKTATNFIQKANLEKNIKVHQALALKTLETFKINYFDFAFIDAD